MTISSTMPVTPSIIVVDALSSLLEAERNSIFRFMDEGSPYLGQATVEVRRPLQEMVRAGERHVAELAALIDQLGGHPLPRSPQSEDQYLAFLSVKFLLPKLADAKKLAIQRYENTVRALKTAEPQVIAVLKAHLAEHRAQLSILEQTAADIAAEK